MGIVNWLFGNFDCYVEELEDFDNKVQEKECKVIKGEYYCKPLFLFEQSIMDDFGERFLGEAFYIRLVGCEGKKKDIYTELISLKSPMEQEEENPSREDLIYLLSKKIKKVRKRLSPYKVETKIVKNLDNIFEEEEIPPEEIEKICKMHN